MELGHEEPTVLLTNHLRRAPSTLITRYAQRMLIENGISEAIQFFHLDALSSMVGLKVDFDLQITLMASSYIDSWPRRLVANISGLKPKRSSEISSTSRPGSRSKSSKSRSASISAPITPTWSPQAWATIPRPCLGLAAKLWSFDLTNQLDGYPQKC